MSLDVLRYHGWTSVRGWLGILVVRPFWAMKLLALRIGYTLYRKLFWTMEDSGYQINTPGALISYWGLCVEGELDKALLGLYDLSVVVDVGANNGAFTRRCRQILPGSLIVAIEPQSELAQRILDAGADICMSNAASDRRRSITMWRGEVGDTGATAEDFDRGESFCVQAETLDEILFQVGHIDLIKIDVEGHVRQVLSGSKETIKRTQSFVIELLTDDEIECAKKALEGFEMQRIGVIDYLFRR